MKLTESGAKASASVFLFWAILLLSRTPGTRQHNEKLRLYNSLETEEGEYPFIVFHLRRLGKVYFSCTGTLINPQWVLTAAHCLRRDSPPRENLFIGGKANLRKYVDERFNAMKVNENINEKEFGVQERRAAAFFVHPLRSSAGSHDIGLVKLDRPFVMNRDLGLAPISRERFSRPMNCTAVGFGLTESKIRSYHLQHIRNIVGSPNWRCQFQKVRDVICLGDQKRGICHGDSGGPLLCGGLLRGVASHGVATTMNCGDGVIEQYYADVYANLRWIESVIREDEMMGKK